MTTSRSRSALSYATVVGVLALTLQAGRARADAVPPPPTDCVAGSQGESCHGGAYCTPPTACTTSADCTGGEVCQPTALCIGQMTCYGSFVGPEGGPSNDPVQTVEGLCTAGACSADGGAACTTMSVCVSPDGTSSSSGGDVVVQNGCSCEAVGVSGGSIGLAVLAFAVGLGLSRRRRDSHGQRPGTTTGGPGPSARQRRA